jgi:hypothetical protein
MAIPAGVSAAAVANGLVISVGTRARRTGRRAQDLAGGVFMMGEQRQTMSAGKPRGEDDRDDQQKDDPVEESIEDTFPASDPPSWSTPAPPPPEDRPSSPDPQSK